MPARAGARDDLAEERRGRRCRARAARSPSSTQRAGLAPRARRRAARARPPPPTASASSPPKASMRDDRAQPGVAAGARPPRRRRRHRRASSRPSAGTRRRRAAPSRRGPRRRCRQRAPGVGRDPGPEGEAVAEARVGRVLDVRVQVDEAGREHAAGQIDAARARDAPRPARRAGPTAAIRSPSTSTAPSASGGALDRHDPVGREERAHASLASSAARRRLRGRGALDAARDPDRDLEEHQQRQQLEQHRDRVGARQRGGDRRRARRWRCGGSCASSREDRTCSARQHPDGCGHLEDDAHDEHHRHLERVDAACARQRVDLVRRPSSRGSARPRGRRRSSRTPHRR